MKYLKFLSKTSYKHELCISSSLPTLKNPKTIICPKTNSSKLQDLDFEVRPPILAGGFSLMKKPKVAIRPTRCCHGFSDSLSLQDLDSTTTLKRSQIHVHSGDKIQFKRSYQKNGVLKFST